MRARRDASDQGVTLVELLVTMFLLSIVGTLVVVATTQAQRTFTNADDENLGLSDAKVVLDRLGTDVRQGRALVCDGGLADPSDATSTDPYCQSHLQVWVDSNSDYAQQATEVITWRLSKSSSAEHYDVWREVGSGASMVRKREATSLWTRFAFTYDKNDSSGHPLFSQVQQVNMQLQYDALVGKGTALRYASFSARLRNKG
jgi:prepilin-type N-terminal cleavage/methylation domain-containing protein